MTTTPIVSLDIDAAMDSWVRWCANPPRSTDVAAAVAAGLLIPGDTYRFTATKAGREWLIANAIANGATATEATMALDYIDGA